MELIYAADPQEIVIELDLEADLQAAGLLLDTYGDGGSLSDADREGRERENQRRVELFDAAYRITLRRIAAERHLTIYIGDCSEATRTPVGDDGDTLERGVWQDAHDQTPAEPLWLGINETCGGHEAGVGPCTNATSRVVFPTNSPAYGLCGKHAWEAQRAGVTTVAHTSPWVYA